MVAASTILGRNAGDSVSNLVSGFTLFTAWSKTFYSAGKSSAEREQVLVAKAPVVTVLDGQKAAEIETPVHDRPDPDSVDRAYQIFQRAAVTGRDALDLPATRAAEWKTRIFHNLSAIR